ncbi:UDP-N-acetylmuramoyl-tripeptide--D-alanyl-D-alanine ligase [Lutibacter sp.]|uniref:UDP-N-acetylmuramoyl-tripeptide--D-alanyl-D- alanine ligase n=1 Tax=Lutibacter sp. TaxID=1925666 RepID=UPI002735B502|nr:UDP-N-acetylmuramoyl-tripeptide--D-alanyl-D-alanine ligase [Lutibacter sp.]MDP3312445.1 UDP-N-acetylmuramoyl-tripeptide--D-alanyl-D-alanine ligase [Lutibacter sp.]
MTIQELYKLYSINFLVNTDTRKIRKGSIYFALKGNNFNGNNFALDALNNGAAYAVIDEEIESHSNIIKVDDVLSTLQKLANYHRKHLKAPIISLTGSNGKTTTKELIYAVLSTTFNATATTGNLNNHIGVPLTLLAMTPKTEIGIVEMGANHIKEIEFLSSIAEPNFGYITNFGKAHLEGFGGVEGIIKGKSELYDFLRNSKGTAFVNEDDPLQVEKSEGIKTIPFNSSAIKFIEAAPFVKVEFDKVQINSQLIGKYNYYNIAAAIAIGNYFKIETSAIKNAIENYIPNNNRSQIIQKGTLKIILDAYNANPSSMEAALENFSQLEDSTKIIFLGDMFELGETSEEEHQKIAELATSFNFKQVFLIGKAFSTTNVKNALIYDSFDSFKDSNNYIKLTNSTILIKGSRGMALERILDLF